MPKCLGRVAQPTYPSPNQTTVGFSLTASQVSHLHSVFGQNNPPPVMGKVMVGVVDMYCTCLYPILTVLSTVDCWVVVMWSYSTSLVCYAKKPDDFWVDCILPENDSQQW